MTPRRLCLLLVLAGLAAAGCSYEPSLQGTVEDTRRIESLFPLIEELGVDSYWVDDECRYFHYRRGSFSNDTSKDGGCRVWTHPDPMSFDAQANSDIDRLITAIREARVPVDYFTVRDPDAEPVLEDDHTFFSIGDCNSLTYDPGYGTLPSFEPDEYDPTLVGAITADWYEIAC